MLPRLFDAEFYSNIFHWLMKMSVGLFIIVSILIVGLCVLWFYAYDNRIFTNDKTDDKISERSTINTLCLIFSSIILMFFLPPFLVTVWVKLFKF
jgi:heme/copper-type cytochrome/quinol oxidase subunit 2